MAEIDRFAYTDELLSVWIAGHPAPVEVSWFWARDHSRDPASFDPSTQQRQIDTFTIDRSSQPRRVDLVDGAIVIEWLGGGTASVLPAEVFGAPTRLAATALWRSSDQAQVTPIPFVEIVDSDEALRRWLDDIMRFGFGLVTDAPGGQPGARQLAERIGYVRRTIFGDMWTLSSEIAEHADSAYGAETLEPHTDGSYSHDGPGTQLFVCEARTGTGGESVLVDGFAAAEHLRLSDPGAFDILSSVNVPAHYVEPGVELRASRPTLRLDDSGELVQVTFNNYDRSPFTLPPAKMQRWYDAYRAFHELVTDRSTWWAQRLEPGDALLFDNWRCLHGRMAYTGVRVFNGCYLNHEDLESRRRVVGR